MSDQAPKEESEVRELLRRPLSLPHASLTLVHLHSVLHNSLFPLPLRTQAADRCFDLLELLLTQSALDSTVLPSLLTVLSSLKSLPAEFLSSLAYNLESALLRVKTVLGEKGLVRGVEDLVAVGKALQEDSDAVFSVDPEQLRAVGEAVHAQHWGEALEGMEGLLRTQSVTLAEMMKTTLSAFPCNLELFPRIERFVTEHLAWFPEAIQPQIRAIYITQGKSLSRTLLPALNSVPSLPDELSSLISAVIQAQTSGPPRTPEKVREEIKGITVRCAVKDAMQVFAVLRTHFTAATTDAEIQGCMVVLKAVQLTKNLSPGKLSDLYNALHKKPPAKAAKAKERKADQKEANPSKEEDKPATSPQGKTDPEESEDYLLDVPLFDPTILPQILTIANQNACSVLQTYTAKRSEFLKCVELFRVLSTVIADDLPGYRIHTFGSLSEGTWTKYSTVDITLFNEEVVEYVLPLNRLMSSLKQHPDIKLDPVFKSKYPVLRVKRADSYFWVNITINNVMGIEIAKLLTRYISLDPRVAQMVAYVKVWAHINGINQSKLGYPSGYSWTLLVLHFLMTIGFLPCLQAKEHEPVLKESCDVWVDEEAYEITDKRSLGHLLMLFFYHYGVSLPSLSVLLDLRSGRLDSIQPCAVLYPLIQPFEESRPLFTLHRNKDIGRKVVNCMRKAYTHIVRQSEVIRLN